MKTDISIAPDWLADKQVQKIFDLLEQDGGQARIVGGAVRNCLLNAEFTDVDFCTDVLPGVVAKRLEDAGYKAIPTGVDHGTITAVVEGKPFEITTLRRDVATDGRRAVVAFTNDFSEDAQRRDLTINALYTDRHGAVYDYVGGLADIDPVQIKFIGDAETRIREDYLRILRFFRFFAEYGQFRPDAGGLKACAKLKDGMGDLSAERIWSEMRKLLVAHDPSRALLWMRQVGVLSKLLPESDKWGIDAIPPLIAAEDKFEWASESHIRLMAMVPNRQETVNDIAKRWKLANYERDRLRAWAALPAQLPVDGKALRALAYKHTKWAVIDGLKVQAAMRRDDQLGEAEAELRNWNMPELPIKGADLIKRGYEKGPQLGAKLKELEAAWIESDFSLTKKDLLSRVKPL